MGAIKAIVDTLATAVKGIVEAATGSQDDKKMNLGDDGQSGPAADASNTLMKRELALMQSRQEMLTAQMQNISSQQNGSQQPIGRVGG